MVVTLQPVQDRITARLSQGLVTPPPAWWPRRPARFAVAGFGAMLIAHGYRPSDEVIVSLWLDPWQY
jgi:hypothetical protein